MIACLFLFFLLIEGPAKGQDRPSISQPARTIAKPESGGICNARSADDLYLTRTRRRARVWILELEKTVFILGGDVDAVEDCSSQPSVQQQQQHPRQGFIKNKKK